MIDRKFLVCGLTGVLLAFAHTAQADEASAVATLKAKGINKTGSLSLAIEADLAKKLKEEFKLKKTLQQASQMLEAAVQNSVQNDAAIAQLNQQLIIANRSNDVAANNAIIAELNLRETQRKQFSDAEREARGKASQAREDYITYTIEARRLAEKIDNQYKLLGEDKEVKSAIEELEKATSKTFAFGPSKTMQASLKSLKKIEDTVLSDEIPLKNSGGGTMLVNAMINGNYSKEMCLDSGSSLVLLPEKLAKEMAVTIPSDAKTIKLKLADGSIIDGKLIALPSVRVGKFEVENVECAVLGESYKGAEPLLGMSFLEKFNFKIDPDVGKLTMTKIDEPGKAGPASADKKGGQTPGRMQKK
jgi:aspartyl protease family protein